MLVVLGVDDEAGSLPWVRTVNALIDMITKTGRFVLFTTIFLTGVVEPGIRRLEYKLRDLHSMTVLATQVKH